MRLEIGLRRVAVGVRVVVCAMLLMVNREYVGVALSGVTVGTVFSGGGVSVVTVLRCGRDMVESGDGRVVDGVLMEENGGVG